MEIYLAQTSDCDRKFRLCHDIGSACYDCFATFPEGMSVSYII